jgi:hypothetical protein
MFYYFLPMYHIKNWALSKGIQLDLVLSFVTVPDNKTCPSAF